MLVAQSRRACCGGATALPRSSPHPICRSSRSFPCRLRPTRQIFPLTHIDCLSRDPKPLDDVSHTLIDLLCARPDWALPRNCCRGTTGYVTTAGQEDHEAGGAATAGSPARADFPSSTTPGKSPTGSDVDAAAARLHRPMMQSMPDTRQQSFDEIYGPPENFLEIEVRLCVSSLVWLTYCLPSHGYSPLSTLSSCASLSAVD
jgi:hypothetical protein